VLEELDPILIANLSFTHDLASKAAGIPTPSRMLSFQRRYTDGSQEI
jgi:hypothetical protein